MNFLVFTLSVLASLIASVGSVVIPGASTPLFYLVSSSPDPASNLLVRQYDNRPKQDCIKSLKYLSLSSYYAASLSA